MEFLQDLTVFPLRIPSGNPAKVRTRNSPGAPSENISEIPSANPSAGSSELPTDVPFGSPPPSRNSDSNNQINQNQTHRILEQFPVRIPVRTFEVILAKSSRKTA